MRDILRRIKRFPATTEEAVQILQLVLSDDDKAYIRRVPRERLMELHFGMAAHLKYVLGLNAANTPLLAACQAANADQATACIISSLWSELRADN